MAIYGQADTDIALTAMSMAYDRGARYIWFWSSDRDHHVPFEEQLTLAGQFSDYVRKHPRRDRRSLIRAAPHAIVLPYGFTFSVSDWDKSQMADLWYRDQFSLREGRTADGVSYYSVLRCAAIRMEELVREGEEFDIVVETPGLESAGYETLHRVVSLAREKDYRYPWWIHYRGYALVALLVLSLACYRAYRSMRWYRRRRKPEQHAEMRQRGQQALPADADEPRR